MARKKSRIVAPGDRFGRFIVIRELPQQGYKRSVEVQCDCGSPPKVVPFFPLVNGESKSCGCLKRDHMRKVGREQTVRRDAIPYNEEEYKGMESGFLKFVRLLPRLPSGALMVQCLCVCGNMVKILATDFLTGHSKSCGCYKIIVAKEQIAKVNEANKPDA